MCNYVDFGNVKTTENQVKKHYTMMSENEIDYIKFLIRGKYFKSCSHVKDKKYIQHSHIRKVFSGYKVIEFNTNYRDGLINNRVLIKSDGIFTLDDDKQYQLCLVLSLTQSCVVTAYYNYVGDSHKTINMNRYEDFDIVDLLQCTEEA